MSRVARILTRKGHAEQSTSASARTGKRVRDPQLDKRLPGHTDSFRFAVDCSQEINRKVDVYALDSSTGASGSCEIEMRAEVCPCSISLAARKGILHQHRSVTLSVGQILRVQNLGPCDLSSLDYQGIPE